MPITRRHCLLQLGSAAACAGGVLAGPGLSAAFAAGGKKNTKQAFLDADSAGPDFAVQGEYRGTLGKAEVGAQVIALGDGGFSIQLYPGGLPGAGWNGKPRMQLTGKAGGDSVAVSGNGFTGAILGASGSFTGTDGDGAVLKLAKVVRSSPTIGAKPPEGALVLFDGSGVEHWQNGKLEDGGLLGVGTRTRKSFQDFSLHLEFRTPFMPYARGQARGNSGMYLLDQYEVQVLDSFGLDGKDNECGGIYKVSRPKVNMCLPPLSWQTYDVEFQAARLDESGKQTAPAVATIRHNGVVIHDQLKLKAPTPGGGRSDQQPGPLFLQNHGDPVRFRNIWVVEK